MSYSSEYYKLRKKRNKKETKISNTHPINVAVPFNTVSQERNITTDIAPFRAPREQMLLPTLYFDWTLGNQNNVGKKHGRDFKETTTF